MSAYVQFTDRPISELNLPSGGGFGNGMARAHDFERQMADPSVSKAPFQVFDDSGVLVCAGLYLGGQNNRDWVLEKVRIHAQSVDSVDPVLLIFEDGEEFVFSPEMDAVVPRSVGGYPIKE